MNHDVAHCLDYKCGKCPSTCPFVQLERDLKTRIDLIGVPITYQSFKDEEVCRKYTMENR